MDVTMFNVHINILHVVVAAIATKIIGAIWYSPLAFGKNWAKAYGFDIRHMKVGASSYLGAALVALVTVLGIAIMLSLFRISTQEEAIQWGLLSWVTFVATSHFSGVIWAKKPLKVYLIDILYLLVIILFNALLLTMWK